MRTYRLDLLLLLLILGIVPNIVRANESEKSVILYTPYTKISVPPGESIDYSIDVINKTDELKNTTISIEGIARGWTSDLKSGGFTISQLAVLPNEKKTFNLKLGVPLKVNKGTYHFKVVAEGEAELPLTVIVTEQGKLQTSYIGSGRSECYGEYLYRYYSSGQCGSRNL